ncbi:FHA domain-containing protein [Microbacterium sp. cx-55]|uniref:FHA domain-containing protein n=1 Tax=Microbacterium sp. cx-55 TaxID=2875948 RepID=UPI001CC0F8F1|nr:FHA domain-containing protein [Microbacterium sp. cx-55]MBZ4488304.1 FHA domain-containing protein [Microbacterium sp. cx-55]UGB34963.1 FHA domain-containing protein [Microbacterium sp. cx-55]
MDDSTVALTIVIVVAVFGVIVAAGWHIWYALGLARVFAQHETDTWRAWVPFMNDAEVLRLGRVDPVKVALFLVPIVNVYALVLKGIAARRLDAEAGRGVGSTVLAVILPPVWAMLAAQTRTPAPVAAPVEAAPAPGVAFPTPAAAIASVAPPRPAGAIIDAPPAPAQLAPAASTPLAPTASPLPPAPPAPVVPAAATPPARPVEMLEEPAPLTRRARRGGEDATAVVRAPAAWELLLPTGETAPVTARVIVLGRNPSATEPGAQYVAVSDEARTVSKNHARVEWNGESWSITDLGSTNGVAVVDAAGAEQVLPAEGTASVTERFVLGDAVVVLRQTTV